RVHARLLGGAQQVDRLDQRALVVVADLGDDVGVTVVRDQLAVDDELRHLRAMVSRGPARRPLGNEIRTQRRRAIGMRVRLVLVGLAVLALLPAASLAKPSPAAQARVVRADWLREIRRRARQDPRSIYPNLPRAVWFTRVRSLEKLYGFRVVEAR